MRKLMIPVVVVLLALLLMSMFVIPEGERGIVIRFGRILKDNNDVSKIYEPGLHFKMPVFDRVRTLDARIQTMNSRSDRFVTSEKKDVIIDSYVKWRIEDFGQYYLATGGGNALTAEALLERRVTDVLRSEIGSREIKQIVSGPRNSNVLPDSADDEAVATEAAKQALEIDGQRDEIMAEVLEETRVNASRDLGVYVVDFRMKKINLPDEISESIYRRMRAERESVARRHRSQGREKAEIIRAQAELEVATIIAEADRTARITRGEADATAAKVYADAYNKDPEFFSFLRSLQAYENSFSQKSDILVLDPKSDFFRYMNSAKGAISK
ncbi:protease modulator HflC [Vibrio sp. V27_P1S3P104]|uniref:protease modulator HflC n=1 Tax=unclassified Vibrio TaxID=2614977 RepID=UPI0013732F1F|nr:MULTISPECIES: protease modulator HflC [unclassified Vibrio]NAW69634.1 protease modulator HflC [Vibrio sp. V28_P6S34P95]NAX06174.1 protease modulator HflC [Vibrio sp. V30_P3S12P165]NAX33099.1 protease modulator HflC [Vibrio sp. V29_P1S30P107]NAX39040.1 protease modulator HflC [Vibrio sp. V27_P1S3P104]NAX39926.1 protease modulator HflC [Vibrio sp. V26_P1S5P106]